MKTTLERIGNYARAKGWTRAQTSAGILAALRLRPDPLAGYGGVGHCNPTRMDVLSVAFPDPELRRAAESICRDRNPRKKNLYSGFAVVSDKPLVERWEKINYKGRFKGWTGSEVYADYGSYVRIGGGGRWAQLVSAGKRGRFHLAPTGTKWRIDNNGPFVCRLTDGLDYHPTLDDLRSRNFAGRVRHGLADAYRKRIAAKRALEQAKTDAETAQRSETIYARESDSTRVNLYDSRRAGNCVQGSLEFARTKLGLSPDDVVAGGYLVHVSATLLRRVANGSGDAVERAVRSAWTRETLVQI